MLVRRLRNEVVKEMGVKNLLGKIGPLCHSSGKEDIQSVVCPASGSLESVYVSSFGSYLVLQLRTADPSQSVVNFVEHFFITHSQPRRPYQGETVSKCQTQLQKARMKTNERQTRIHQLKQTNKTTQASFQSITNNHNYYILDPHKEISQLH